MERLEKRELILIQFRVGEDIRGLMVQEAQVQQIDLSEYVRQVVMKDLENKGHLATRRKFLVQP
jgi:hypothetical protein